MNVEKEQVIVDMERKLNAKKNEISKLRQERDRLAKICSEVKIQLSRSKENTSSNIVAEPITHNFKPEPLRSMTPERVPEGKQISPYKPYHKRRQSEMPLAVEGSTTEFKRPKTPIKQSDRETSSQKEIKMKLREKSQKQVEQVQSKMFPNYAQMKPES